MTELATATPVRLNTPDLFFRAQAKDQDGAAIDLTFATLMELVFRHPDYPTVADVVETAVVSTKTTPVDQTNPADGWLEFQDDDPATKTTAENEWRYWARVTIGTDGPFPSNPLTYCVAAEGDDT